MNDNKNTNTCPRQIWGVRLLDADGICVHEEWFVEDTTSKNYNNAVARKYELLANDAYRAYLPDTPWNRLLARLVLSMDEL